MESLRSSRGFTLVELLVVLGIIGALALMAVVNQNSFNKSFILTNTAYDVALMFRSAETYGVSSRATSAGAANISYGLSFSTASANTFTFFADSYPGAVSGGDNCDPINANTPNCKPGNFTYDSGSDQIIQTYKFGNGITIREMCAFSTGVWSCTGETLPAGGTLLSKLDIVFARPNPDPFITRNGDWNSDFPVTQACITIQSPAAPTGPFRHIAVGQSGQITANGTSCP